MDVHDYIFGQSAIQNPQMAQNSQMSQQTQMGLEPYPLCLVSGSPSTEEPPQGPNTFALQQQVSGQGLQQPHIQNPKNARKAPKARNARMQGGPYFQDSIRAEQMVPGFYMSQRQPQMQFAQEGQIPPMQQQMQQKPYIWGSIEPQQMLPGFLIWQGQPQMQNPQGAQIAPMQQKPYCEDLIKAGDMLQYLNGLREQPQMQNPEGARIPSMQPHINLQTQQWMQQGSYYQGSRGEPTTSSAGQHPQGPYPGAPKQQVSDHYMQQPQMPYPLLAESPHTPQHMQLEPPPPNHNQGHLPQGQYLGFYQQLRRNEQQEREGQEQDIEAVVSSAGSQLNFSMPAISPYPGQNPAPVRIPYLPTPSFQSSDKFRCPQAGSIRDPEDAAEETSQEESFFKLLSPLRVPPDTQSSDKLCCPQAGSTRDPDDAAEETSQRESFPKLHNLFY